METNRNQSQEDRTSSNAFQIKKIKNKDTGYDVRNTINDNFSNLDEKISNITTKFKGYHISEYSLRQYYPQAETKKDDFAWAGSPYPGTVWKVDVDGGAWQNTWEKPKVDKVDLSEYVKTEKFTRVTDSTYQSVWSNRAYINNISGDYVIDSYYPISDDFWETEYEPIPNDAEHMKLILKTELRSVLPHNQELLVSAGINNVNDISGTVSLIDANLNIKELGQFVNNSIGPHAGLKNDFVIGNGEYQQLQLELIVPVKVFEKIVNWDLVYLNIGLRASILEVHDYFENKNVNQFTGSSTTQVMSQDATTRAISTKAAIVKEDGSTVSYLTSKGNLPDGVVPLASEQYDGLMSKEMYKEFLEMKENAMDLRTKFGNHIICGFDNEVFGEFVSLFRTQTLRGEPEFVTRNSEMICEGNLGVTGTAVGHFFTRVNDVVTSYINDVDKIFISDSTSLSFLHIKTRKDSLLKTIDLFNSSVIGINFNDFYSLKELYASGTKRLKGIDLSNNNMLAVVLFSKAKELEYVGMYGGSELTDLIFSESSKMKTISILNGNTVNLKNVHIDGTILSKDSILSLESKWASRIGKDTGILKLSKSLYDTMSSDDRKLFTDKNITFDIVA